MDGSGWECYHDEQKRVAERDATIAELRAELAQLHSDFSTNAIALGKVAVERNELRADRDALRARCEELETELSRIMCPACGTRDGCGCASPGWTFTKSKADGQGLCILSDGKVAAPPCYVLTDCGAVVPDSSRPVPPGHVRDEKGVDRRAMKVYVGMAYKPGTGESIRVQKFECEIPEAAEGAKEPT